MFRSRNLYSSFKKYKECAKSLQKEIRIQGGKHKDHKNFKNLFDNYKTSCAKLVQKAKCIGKNERSFITSAASTFIKYSGKSQNNTTDKKTDTSDISKQLGIGLDKENLKYFVPGAVALGAEHKTEVPITSDPIPDLPPIPEAPAASPFADAAAEIASQLNALGEPTFASLGLGGWTPVGIVQNCFEYLHITLGIPWWEAIVIGTIIIRTLMLPLVIISQRNAARMNNYLPQLQVIQMKLTEARQSGNEMEVARYSQELMLFMKEKGVNPLKNMIVPLAQMPIFISFFMGLREMATTPVESLKTGGIFWFQDLTLPDQYFAMPIITSLTLWATIELGTDSAKLSAQNMQIMSYVLRALPLVIIPFTVNFPGAILCYWVSSNFISLAQVGILRLPVVRDFFNIEALVKHKAENLPMKKKGFSEGLKDSWTNIKLTKELEERKRLDELQFQRAGKGPVVKTYKYDPTKQAPASSAANAISAKKR